MPDKERRDRPLEKPAEKREDPRKIERRTEPSRSDTPGGPPGPALTQGARVGPFQSEGGVDVLHYAEVDLRRSLGSVRFPAGKEDLLLHARGAKLSPDLITRLEAIPERDYDSLAAVESELRRAA